MNHDFTYGGVATVPTVKAGKSRQVVIPKEIWDEMNFSPGEYFEVKVVKGNLVLVPKKLVDRDELLSPEDEVSLAKGLAELNQGKGMKWEEFKKKHGLDR